MRHKRNFVLALLVMVAMPLLACDPNVVNVWGDLVASAQFIWNSIWTEPEPDFEAIGILCTQSLLATYGEPPVDGPRERYDPDAAERPGRRCRIRRNGRARRHRHVDHGAGDAGRRPALAGSARHRPGGRRGLPC